MKIAFAMINCNRRDGSARAVNEVAERLASRGHEVDLYARTVTDLDLNRIRWHKIPGPHRPEVVDFTSYRFITDRLLQRKRQTYDVIHSIGPNTTLANVVTIQNIQPAKVEILKAFAASEQISIFRRLTRAMYLRQTCRAEKQLYLPRDGKQQVVFLPVSQGVANELTRHYSIGDQTVEIIPNAADVSLFSPVDDERRQLWRSENKIPRDALLAIFSGGEWARKGLHLAIESLVYSHASNLHLFVAGDDPDRNRFRDLAAQHNLQARIHFGGFRNDVALAMAASDLFLFPSFYEAFSLATIEAAACGLPIFASKINGTEDFIEPGVNGYFVPHDPQGIAAVLNRVLQQSSQLKQLGVKARSLVCEHYTWDRITDLTERAYAGLVAREARNG